MNPVDLQLHRDRVHHWFVALLQLEGIISHSSLIHDVFKPFLLDS